MGGFFGAVGPWINAATQTAGAYQGAEANANKQAIQDALQQFAVKRQTELDQLNQSIQRRKLQSMDVEDALHRSQAGLADAKTYDKQHPSDTFEPVTGLDQKGVPQIYRFGKQSGTIAPTGVGGKPEQPIMGSQAWKEAEAYKKSLDPDHYAFPTGTDAKGNPVIYRASTKTGAIAPTGVGAKQTGGSSSGAQVPVADMEQRYSEIEQHARNLLSNKWTPTRTMQAREGLGYAVAKDNAAGNPPVRKMLELGGMDLLHLGQGDGFTDFQSMMNSTRSLGDDMTKAFKGRQNEQAVNREVALAQLTPEDFNNPQVVEQKLSRLRHVIAMARSNNPHQPSGGSGAVLPRSATTGTADKILSKYQGFEPPPQQDDDEDE